jgi:hypothetical protein
MCEHGPPVERSRVLVVGRHHDVRASPVASAIGYVHDERKRAERGDLIEIEIVVVHA